MARPEKSESIDTSKPHWWRKLTDSCPISLDPLRRLRVEPFNLPKDEGHAGWFDGKVLAQYIVSTGVFVHPVSRRELTRDDCEALDAHLTKHKLGKASVCYAFDHQEDYKKKDSPENQVLRLQEEASALLRSLYSGGSYSADGSGQEGRGGRGGRGRGSGRGSGGRQEEAPAEEPAVVDEEQFAESVPLGGADLESPADFPTLDGAPAPRTSALFVTE